MENLKFVKEVISDLERRNWDKVENNLSNDFTFTGAVSQPINKKQWVGVHRALQTGMPDLKFNLQQVRVVGDNKVAAKVKLTGTHTAEMPATLPGTKPIPATGRKIALPEEDIEFTLKGDKISSLYVKPVDHGGVKGILDQLEAVHVES